MPTPYAFTDKPSVTRASKVLLASLTAGELEFIHKLANDTSQMPEIPEEKPKRRKKKILPVPNGMVWY